MGNRRLNHKVPAWMSVACCFGLLTWGVRAYCVRVQTNLFSVRVQFSLKHQLHELPLAVIRTQGRPVDHVCLGHVGNLPFTVWTAFGLVDFASVRCTFMFF